MPRKNLIRSKEFPYHVTARANNKEPFPIPLSEMWQIIVDELLLLGILYRIEVQALVVMPNHIHLMISTPQEDLGKIMNLFMSDVTRATNSRSHKSGHLFGGPYYWSIISSTRYYGHALKYVYRNPVKAGLCEKVEEYEFSTLRGTLGLAPAHLPLHYTRLGMEINLPEPENVGEWLAWLNKPFPTEAEEFVRLAMRRREIKQLKNPRTRFPVQILEELI